MKKVNVLSLFDGITPKRSTSVKLNMPPRKFKIYKRHFPDTKQLGDITMKDT